jgi:cyclomaltodextrinase / maltogenic alpha-amylase / neopullulanase
MLYRISPRLYSFIAAALGWLLPSAAVAEAPDHWAVDAVWYQIFTERFRNGDPANDPTRESLETPIAPSENWRLSRWTADWYARDGWEEEMGTSFFDHGVFHRRFGGDLQGVLEKLDYLRELGVTAIYFNPVFHARSMHKYDASSFHHIDPYFGPDPEGDLAMMEQETNDPATWQWTAADRLFLELIQQARQRGIRVVIDGVFNHTGREFWAFRDLRLKQEKSPYREWYRVRRFDDPRTRRNDFEYEGWWGFMSLPVFAQNPERTDLHPGPKQYVFDITRRWMAPDGDVSRGIDGWRLDVAEEVPTGFWREWNELVREINPEAYTVAEIWGDAKEFVEKGGFSATMNYYGFAVPAKGFLIDNTIKGSEFFRMLTERKEPLPAKMAYTNQNLLDSHDTDRVASMIVNRRVHEYSRPEKFDYDEGRAVTPRHSERYLLRKPNEDERRIQKLVTLFQMTYLGAPMVYYGTEAGMWGGDDPCDRMPMLWPELQFDPQAGDPRGNGREPDTVEFDAGLFAYFKGAIGLRHAHAALRRGNFQPLPTPDAENVVAYARMLGDERIVVVLNRSREERRTSLFLRGPLGEAKAVERLFFTEGEGEEAPAHLEGRVMETTLPPLSGAVYRLQ